MEEAKHILVTGGAGYIGSILVPLLLQENKYVTVLDALEPMDASEQKLAHPRLKVVCGDIKDPHVVEHALEEADSVIYLAGVSDGRAGKSNPALTKSVNEDAFGRFVNQAKQSRCRRIVFASTFGVYGYDYTRPLTELLSPNPEEPYSASKLAAEQILQAANEASFVTTSLRFAMVFGFSPRMRWEFIVNRLISDAVTRGEIKIMGGSQIRPQIHIKDVCRYLSAMLDLRSESVAGQVFNACGFNRSIEQVANEIREYIGNDVRLVKSPGRAGEHTFSLDQSKLEQHTGLQPVYTLTDGIGELKAYLDASLIQT